MSQAYENGSDRGFTPSRSLIETARKVNQLIQRNDISNTFKPYDIILGYPEDISLISPESKEPYFISIWIEGSILKNSPFRDPSFYNFINMDYRIEQGPEIIERKPNKLIREVSEYFMTLSSLVSWVAWGKIYDQEEYGWLVGTLAPHVRLSGEEFIPKTLNGVKVYQVASIYQSLGGPSSGKIQRPLMLGDGIGTNSSRNSTGSIGLFFRSKTTGKNYLVSSQHILSSDNQDSHNGRVLQPSIDNWMREHERRPRVDELKSMEIASYQGGIRNNAQIRFNGAEISAGLDVGWALLNEGVSFNPECRSRYLCDLEKDTEINIPLPIGVIEENYFDTFDETQFVYKVGQTTGVTRGICHWNERPIREFKRYNSFHKVWSYFNNNAPHENLQIPFIRPDIGIVLERQILIDSETKDFALPGDSGSLIIDHSGKILGLINGGMQKTGLAAISDIRYIWAYIRERFQGEELEILFPTSLEEND